MDAGATVFPCSLSLDVKVWGLIKLSSGAKGGFLTSLKHTVSRLKGLHKISHFVVNEQD